MKFNVKFWKTVHSYFGLFLSFVFVLVGVSGFLLMDRNVFGLRQQTVEFQPLLAWYGRTGTVDDQVVNNENTEGSEEIASPGEGRGRRRGAVAAGVAEDTAGQGRGGRGSGQRGGAAQVGMQRGGGGHGGGMGLREVLALSTNDGTPLKVTAFRGVFYFQATDGTWTPINEADLEVDISKEVVDFSNGTSNGSAPLGWRRIILDLHTGRFFGNWMEYVYYVAAAAMVLLTFSGMYLWYKPWIQKRRRNQRLSQECHSGNSASHMPPSEDTANPVIMSTDN